MFSYDVGGDGAYMFIFVGFREISEDKKIPPYIREGGICNFVENASYFTF